MKFASKVVESTYQKAIGHTFNHRPSKQRFVDENGSTDYNYWAMIWLLDEGILQSSYDITKSFATQFTIKGN
jgi:hypothetical protein